MFVIDHLAVLVFPFAVICYVGLAWWYNSAIKKIERRHDIEMKRITDQYEERMKEITDDYHKSIDQASERYKQACLKYELMRTIKG